MDDAGKGHISLDATVEVNKQSDPADRSYKLLFKTTRAALKDGTAKNPIKVCVSSESQSGFRSHIRIRDFEIISDQPFGFNGTNAGPKPSELLLAGLAACQEITWRLYADTMSIDLRRISVELEGVQDLNGFLGTDDTVPAGFQSIRGTVFIESDADDAELEKLKRIVDDHCPVLDDLIRNVPVALELSRFLDDHA